MSDQQGSGWIGDSELGERFPAWTRGNAADVFPDPFSVLGKSLVLLKAMSPGLRDAYIDLGALDYDEYENPDAPDLFKMFGGYVYNPLTLTRILGARMPGASPEMIDQAFFDERDEVPPYEEQPWHISESNEAKLGESVGWAMSAQSLPELDADRDMARAQREQRPDLESLTDSALLARARSMVPLLQQTFETRCACRRSPGSARAHSALFARGSAIRAWRSACSPASRSIPRHRRDAMWELGRVAAASDAVQRDLRCRPRRRPRSAPCVRLARCRRFPRALRHVPVRARRPRTERVRPLRDVMGSQATDRAGGDRPDAPVRRVAGAEQSPRRIGRRAGSHRRRDPGEDRRRPRDRRHVRGGARLGAVVPRRP